MMSCHPTNRVKALKETQSTDSSQWPGFILSLSIYYRVPDEVICGELKYAHAITITSHALKQSLLLNRCYLVYLVNNKHCWSVFLLTFE